MTTYICGECGSVYEEDSEFCYVCGAMRKSAIVIDDKGAQIVKDGFCPECGVELENGRCPSCNRMNYVVQPTVRKKLTLIDYAAIVLAIIPGAFNVFGLGHILLRKWSRAFLYLCLSAVIIYLRTSIGDSSTTWWFTLEVLGFFIYMKQSFEVIKSLYGGI